jgi:hypothetical protein
MKATMSDNGTDISQPTVRHKDGVRSIYWPAVRTQVDLAKTADLLVKGNKIYAMQGKRVGEILHSLGVINDDILRAVEQHHSARTHKPKPIGQLLANMSIINSTDLTKALCIQFGIPMVDLSLIRIPQGILNRIPKEEAVAKNIVPVGAHDKILFLAVADPFAFSDATHFSFITNLKVKPMYSPGDEIAHFINEKWNADHSYSWDGSEN